MNASPPAEYPASTRGLPTFWPFSGPLDTRVRDLLTGIGPVLVGIIVALPMLLLLVNSFNIAAPGRDPVYGVRDWIQAFTDAATMRALGYTLVLGLVRTAISL